MTRPRYVKISRKSKTKLTQARRKYKTTDKKLNSKLKRGIRRGVKPALPAVIKRPTLPLNLDFYNSVDGVYSSY